MAGTSAKKGKPIAEGTSATADVRGGANPAADRLANAVVRVQMPTTSAIQLAANADAVARAKCLHRGSRVDKVKGRVAVETLVVLARLARYQCSMLMVSRAHKVNGGASQLVLAR
jgi:hypothetical protein